MTTIGENTTMKIYTEDRYLCPACQRTNNFIYVVKKDESKYYLGEKCPKCDHYENFQQIPSRMAADYPAPQK